MDTTDFHAINYWTEKEIAILKENYTTLGIDAICKLLPRRSVFTIRNRAFLLNLTKKIVNADRDEQICELWLEDRTASMAGIGRRFGVSRERIRQIIQNHNTNTGLKAAPRKWQRRDTRGTGSKGKV